MREAASKTQQIVQQKRTLRISANSNGDKMNIISNIVIPALIGLAIAGIWIAGL